jgi:hypothetical protein
MQVGKSQLSFNSSLISGHDQIIATAVNEAAEKRALPEQLPLKDDSILVELANAAEERRDRVRKIAVGVMQVNTRQKMIDTYLQVASKNETAEPVVTVTDVLGAARSISSRKLLIALIEMAQNRVKAPQQQPPQPEPYVSMLNIEV